MSNQEGQRKELETWDEAFRALAPVVRQQSVRVAAYTQVLYVQACASGFGTDTPQGEERMKGEYADLAYKCGLYHQLGKALVPEEYQVWRNSFSDEEKALYRKYPSAGRLLVARLQEKGKRSLTKNTAEGETPTNNITWLMIREACEQHMERWNATGYPDGRMGNEISVIAQIVGLAKELDKKASGIKSENPFDEAYVELMEQADKGFSKELLEVLSAAKGKCRGVYKKYINYTNTLAKTIPLVDKREDRVMGLKYRPMITGPEGQVAAYEAIPWFGGVAGVPSETETMKELEPMLVRTKIVDDITIYFLYEATDALLRQKNCKLKTEGILLPVLDNFYEGEDKWFKLEQVFQHQPVDMSKLLLTVSEELLKKQDPQVKKNLIHYVEKGLSLVLDNHHIEGVSLQEVQEIGFTHIKMAPELYEMQETANYMATLKNKGFTLIGASADNHERCTWLKNSGVTLMSGTISGVPVEEDEMIRELLAGE